MRGELLQSGLEDSILQAPASRGAQGLALGCSLTTPIWGGRGPSTRQGPGTSPSADTGLRGCSPSRTGTGGIWGFPMGKSPPADRHLQSLLWVTWRGGFSRAATGRAQGRGLQQRGPGLNPPINPAAPQGRAEPPQTPCFSPGYGGVPPGVGLGTAPLLGWPCHLLAGPGTAGGDSPGTPPSCSAAPRGTGTRQERGYSTLGPSLILPGPGVSSSSSSLGKPTCATTPGTTSHHQVPLSTTGYHRTSPGTTSHHHVTSTMPSALLASPPRSRHGAAAWGRTLHGHGPARGSHCSLQTCPQIRVHKPVPAPVPAGTQPLAPGLFPRSWFKGLKLRQRLIPAGFGLEITDLQQVGPVSLTPATASPQPPSPPTPLEQAGQLKGPKTGFFTLKMGAKPVQHLPPPKPPQHFAAYRKTVPYNSKVFFISCPPGQKTSSATSFSMPKHTLTHAASKPNRRRTNPRKGNLNTLA